MHRSGTRLITRAVHVLGASLGNNLMPPKPDNPTGFWEDNDVAALNERMLDGLDLAWDVPTVFPLLPPLNHSFSAYRTEASNLLRKKVSGHKIFALKDPRLCLLLPVWLDAAQRVGIKSRFVVVLRNPLDVAESLLKRNSYPLNRGLALWRSYNLLILRLLSQLTEESAFISYSDFLLAPTQGIEKLVAFVGTESSPEQIHQASNKFASQFLNPALCHSESTLEELSEAAEKIQGVLSLYECFSEFCISGWHAQRAQLVLDETDWAAVEADNYRRHPGQIRLANKLQLEDVSQRFSQKSESDAKRHAQELEKEKSHSAEQLAALRKQLQTAFFTELSKREQVFATVTESLGRELRKLSERKDAEIDALHKRHQQAIELLEQRRAQEH
jgi:hypothetical protein